MAELPKIDSEGLRLAKLEGAKRVSSAISVSRSKRWAIQWIERHSGIMGRDFETADTMAAAKTGYQSRYPMREILAVTTTT